MKSSLKPAIQQAISVIRDHIESGFWKPGEFLPSARKLAVMAQVSKSTMLKAIDFLRTDGNIECKERYRMRVKSLREEDPVIDYPRWHQTRTRFEKDLFSGAFNHQDRLPTIKELQARYHVCYSTMRKVLRSAEADGVLAVRGTGMTGSTNHTPSWQSRIVFITMQGHLSQRSALNVEHNHIVSICENECRRRGKQLDIIEIDVINTDSARLAAARLKNNDAVMGFILDVWWYEMDNLRQSYQYILARLVSFKKPIAILDELGDFTLPAEFNANPLLQAFSIQRASAGQAIARHLLALGHTSVVYIGPPSQMTWSRDRFNGLAMQLTRAGVSPHRIHVVTSDFPDPLLDLLAASGLDQHGIERFTRIGRTPSQATDLWKRWKTFMQSNPQPAFADKQEYSVLRKSLEPLRVLMESSADDESLLEACTGALTVGSKFMFALRMRPLFEKALSYSEATAWVCAADYEAFEALRFLRNRNIQVPRELSVVGFDNVPVAALEARLTTFDFNALGFANQMLSFIQRPHHPRGHYRHSVIEVEGMVLERETTGSPGKKIS